MIFLALVTIFCIASFVPSGLAWVLRAVGYLLLGIFAWRAVVDLPRVTDWLVHSPLGWYRNLCAWAEIHRRGILKIEIVLALVVIIPAAAHFGQNAIAMAGAPLRIDEIGSIRAYAGRGPFVSSATYNLAKNHIFFSILNSLTPGSGSLNPLRARIWSFAAVAMALVALAASFWKWGSPLAGAVAFAIPALNSDHLTKALEARGYGLLALMAAIGLISLYEFLRSSKTRALWILGVSVVLGTWTLPFYIIFGGSLMLMLFLLQPNRKTFLAGVAALLSIIALYSLVIASVFQVAAEYDEKYGEIFTSLESVFKAMSLSIPASLWRMDGISFLVAGMLVFGLPLVLRSARPEATQSLRVATLLIVGFYLFCLVLASPPVRITAFLAMPVAFVCGMFVLQVLTYPGLAILRPALGVMIAVVFLLAGKSALANFHFLPDQRWEHAANAIRAAFPKGTKIASPTYGKFLSAYLGKDYKITKEMPSGEDLKSGQLLLFDPTHKSDHKILDVHGLYPNLDFAEVRFQVQKGLTQILYVPMTGWILIPKVTDDGEKLSLPAKTSDQQHLRLEVPEGDPIRTLNFVFDPQTITTAPDIIPIYSEGSYHITKISNLVVLTFTEPFPDGAIELNVSPQPHENQPVLQSVWVGP